MNILYTSWSEKEAFKEWASLSSRPVVMIAGSDRLTAEYVWGGHTVEH